VKRVMVRYRVKPERASENVELARAVYDELHQSSLGREVLRGGRDGFEGPLDLWL
jgi:hypothetical protein